MKKVILMLGLISVSLSGYAQDQTTPRPDSFEPGVFELFDAPNYQLTGCDRATALELSEGAHGKIATLSNYVVGVCDLHVPPRVRSYGLRVEDAGCGSYRYVFSPSGVDPLIVITDHRNRTCRDIQPASIIVRELSGDSYKMLYSQ